MGKHSCIYISWEAAHTTGIRPRAFIYNIILLLGSIIIECNTAAGIHLISSHLIFQLEKMSCSCLFAFGTFLQCCFFFLKRNCAGRKLTSLSSSPVFLAPMFERRWWHSRACCCSKSRAHPQSRAPAPGPPPRPDMPVASQSTCYQNSGQAGVPAEREDMTIIGGNPRHE